MTKTEFFQQDFIKKSYEYYKDGVYRRRKGAEGIGKNVEYIKWDALHSEVEVYNKAYNHLGACDPLTLELYKAAVKGRKPF